jgi:DNA-binding Lrp family transcriptional regulator
MDIIPDSESIKKILLNEPTIQFAAITKGDYNLIFYIFAENTQILENRIYDIRSSEIFANRNSEWIVSYMTYSYGYVPITDNFIDHMLKDKVWHRSREKPRRQKGQILEREYLVIKALNKNSRMDFSEIDRMYNLNDGASQYTYKKLIENNTILRTTIKMSNLPLKYNLILKCEQKNINEFNSKRLEYLLHTIDDTNTPINKYVLIGDIGATYGLLLIAPIFNENDDIEVEIKRHIDGVKISTSIMTRVLIGELGYRRINRLDTPQYEFIENARKSSIQNNQ